MFNSVGIVAFMNSFVVFVLFVGVECSGTCWFTLFLWLLVCFVCFDLAVERLLPVSVVVFVFDLV